MPGVGRGTMKHTLYVLPFLALVACSNSETPGTGGHGGNGGGDAGPPPNQLRVDTPSYTVDPGQEVRYKCFSFHMPADKAVVATEIAPIYGDATHHLVVYTPALNPVPEGAFNCTSLFEPDWVPVYTGGVETTPLVAPPGAGFHFQPNQQLLIQVHLLNTGTKSVDTQAGIVFKTTDDTSLTPAGIYGLDNFVIDIPPQSTGTTVSMDCPAKYDLDVFSVFGHMHTRGQKIEFFVDGQSKFSQTWDFNNQLISPLSLHVAQGSTLRVDCTYNNPGSTDVMYGESTDNEMCAFVLWYTPFSMYDGCQKITP